MKYVSMVVGVTVVVAGVLGYFAYEYSTGQTALLQMNQLESQQDLSPDFVAFIEAEAIKADRRVLVAIIGGILCLVLALGITGIVITHRLVGPAYRIKQLIGEVREGHLNIKGGIRKSDELKDIFLAFEEMVMSLRSEREKDIDRLNAAIARAKEAGLTEEVIQSFLEIRDRMKESLQ
jgi:methyl-accepting chemotaxis protein